VGERQSPETQVGGRVGDAAEDKLDRLDELLDECLAEAELLARQSARRRAMPNSRIHRIQNKEGRG